MLNSSQHFSSLHKTFMVDQTRKAVFHFKAIPSSLQFLTVVFLFWGLNIMDPLKRTFPQLPLKMSVFCPENALGICHIAKFPNNFCDIMETEAKSNTLNGCWKNSC